MFLRCSDLRFCFLGDLGAMIFTGTSSNITLLYVAAPGCCAFSFRFWSRFHSNFAIVCSACQTPWFLVQHLDIFVMYGENIAPIHSYDTDPYNPMKWKRKVFECARSAVACLPLQSSEMEVPWPKTCPVTSCKLGYDPYK